MPWHLRSDHPDCPGVAVVLDATGKVVPGGCHPTRDKALAHLAALNANAKGASMQTELERAVDNSTWSADAALAKCKTASDYRSVCAGERSEGDPDQRQHWALPHHSSPGGPPNAGGVRAALAALGGARGGKPNIANTEEARRHLERHMAEVRGERSMPEETPTEIVRALPDLEVDEPPGDGTIAVVRGDLSVFGEWAKIESVFEGEFMERVLPGTFTTAFERDRDRTQFLLDHGGHPVQGRLPLGPIYRTEQTPERARYEAGLLDTEFARDLLPGLKAGLYGSSFRGRIGDDMEVDRWPRPSDHNPEGIPEHSVRSVTPLLDFGPTPFPAYLGAKARASARSMTDDFIFRHLESGEGLRRFHEWAQRQKSLPIEVRSAPDAPAANDPAPASDATSTTHAADVPPPSSPPAAQRSADPKEGDVPPEIDKYDSRELLVARRDEIAKRVQYLGAEHSGRSFPTDVKTEWDELKAESKAINARIGELDERAADIAAIVGQPPADVNGNGSGGTSGADDSRWTPDSFDAKRSRIPENVYDIGAYRASARSLEDEAQLMVSGARKAIEIEHYPHEELSREQAQSNVSDLLDRVRGATERESGRSMLARHILATGSETYRRAAAKYVAFQEMAALEPEEQRALLSARALSLTGAAGGFAVPFELDPSLILTSTGAVNPIRSISRVIPITVDEWRGVSSAGVTAAFAAEATETTDNAPTLAQPTISTEKAQAFIPFSIEVGQDWDGLQAEMARALGDAKAELESAKFTTGTGTNEPFGVLTGTTNTINAAAGADAFTLANLYSLAGSLPPRYRQTARYMADLAILNRIRQFDTAGGAALWVQLGGGTPDTLLGKPVYENSDMPDDATTGNKFLLFGDFSRFVIVDRVGLSIDLIPHLFGTNHRPTGQRGIYAFWRVGSKVVDANAFRALLGTA